jgi:plastocyanin
MTTHRLRSAALCAVVAIVIGGCGSSGQPAGTVVIVVETEYKIVLSQGSFTPGTYTFDVTNHGQKTHSLEINGPGVRRVKLPENLGPGQSATMTVILRAGTYDVFCDIDRHKARGMDVSIHVTG